MAFNSSDNMYWSPGRQKFMIVFVMVGFTLLFAGRTIMAICMPVLSDEMEWDKKDQGLVLGSFLWGYPCTQILGGYLSDKFGAHKVIFYSFTVMSGVTLLTPAFAAAASLGYGNSLIMVTISRVLQGFLQGFFFPSVTSWVSARIAEKDRTFAYSTMAAGVQLGVLVNGFLGSLILHHFTWQAVFYTIGSCGLIWGVLLYKIGDRHQPNVVSLDEPVIKNDSPSAKPVTATLQWGKVLMTTAFWATLFAHLTQGFSFYCYLFWLPTFFHEVYPSESPWVYNSLPWIFDMTSSILTGLLADHMIASGYTKTFTRKLLNIFAEGGFGAGLILMTYSTNYRLTLFIVSLTGVCHGCYHSTIMMTPSDIAPNHVGLMFGIMNTFGAIPSFFGTYIGGAILHATDSWNIMFTIVGMPVVAGCAAFTYFGTADPLT